MKLISLLSGYPEAFHPVVRFDTKADRFLPLDFTTQNKELSADLLNDTVKFSAWVANKLSSSGVQFGIGGYGEHRTIYAASTVFDGENIADEPRRLHLGTDIWSKAGTAVMAPLDGTVHSFAFNDRFGDYGATIILKHEISGHILYTLYGHLGLASISTIREGNTIRKGDEFAMFGTPDENGHWPPHLHFQIIEEIGNWKGDYPGVCKFSQKGEWLANSPNPEFILQLEKYMIVL